MRQPTSTTSADWVPAVEGRIRHTEENSRYLASVDQKAFKAAYDSIAECLPFDVVMGETAPDNEINVLGFAVRLPDTQKEKKPYVLLERLGERYPVPMGETAPGNARRIINRLKKFDALADELSKAKHENEARQKEIQAHLAETSNPYEAQMRQCEAEISQLHNLLQMAG